MKTKLVFTAMAFLLLAFSTIGVYGQSAAAEAAYERGWTAIDQNNIDRAITEFTEAIRLYPNYALAYNGRGWAYFLEGEYTRSISEYNQAIRINPNESYSYSGRGIALAHNNETNRAISDLNTALRLNPNNDTAIMWLERLQPTPTPAPAQNNQVPAWAQGVWITTLRHAVLGDLHNELTINATQLIHKDWRGGETTAPFQRVEGNYVYFGRGGTISRTGENDVIIYEFNDWTRNDERVIVRYHKVR